MESPGPVQQWPTEGGVLREVLRRAGKRKRRGRVPQECTDCVCQPRLEREREPTLGTLRCLLFVQLLLDTPRMHLPASLSEKTSMWSPLFDSSPWWLACNSVCLQDKGDIPWGSLAADHCHSDLPAKALSLCLPCSCMCRLTWGRSGPFYRSG